MELITLKDASRITSLKYTYLYNNRISLGFFKINNKGKWFADKETFDKLNNIIIAVD